MRQVLLSASSIHHQVDVVIRHLKITTPKQSTYVQSVTTELCRSTKHNISYAMQIQTKTRHSQRVGTNEHIDRYELIQRLSHARQKKIDECSVNQTKLCRSTDGTQYVQPNAMHMKFGPNLDISPHKRKRKKSPIVNSLSFFLPSSPL